MLIDIIIVTETDEIGEYNRPKLDIEIVWNTPYINIGDIIEGLEAAVLCKILIYPVGIEELKGIAKKRESNREF